MSGAPHVSRGAVFINPTKSQVEIGRRVSVVSSVYWDRPSRPQLLISPFLLRFVSFSFLERKKKKTKPNNKTWNTLDVFFQAFALHFARSVGVRRAQRNVCLLLLLLLLHYISDPSCLYLLTPFYIFIFLPSDAVASLCSLLLLPTISPLDKPIVLHMCMITLISFALGPLWALSSFDATLKTRVACHTALP